MVKKLETINKENTVVLYDDLSELYDRLRLMHYRSLFTRIKEKDGSLSATEAFSVDAIYLLGEPTIKQFAGFLGISQPNATYKISSLIDKGYVTKSTSEEDRRESHLRVSDKFLDYCGDRTQMMADAARLLESRFSAEELSTFNKVLNGFAEALKQEDNNGSF